MKLFFCIFVMAIVGSSYVQADKYIFMHGPQQFLLDTSDGDNPKLTALNTTCRQFNSQEELDTFKNEPAADIITYSHLPELSMKNFLEHYKGTFPATFARTIYSNAKASLEESEGAILKIEAAFDKMQITAALVEGKLHTNTQENREAPANIIKCASWADQSSDSNVAFYTIKQNAQHIEMQFRQNNLGEKEQNSFSAQLNVARAKTYTWLLPKSLACESTMHAGTFSTQGTIFERVFCEVPFAVMHYTNAGETCEAEHFISAPFDPYKSSACNCPKDTSGNCSIL